MQAVWWVVREGTHLKLTSVPDTVSFPTPLSCTRTPAVEGQGEARAFATQRGIGQAQDSPQPSELGSSARSS
jgi:hypothetical protein